MSRQAGVIVLGSREIRPAMQDWISLLEPEVEVRLVGILDGLTEEEIAEQFSFAPGEDYLITKMPWGTTVQMSERKANDAMQRLAEQLFQEGADTVLVWCTGDFRRPEVPAGKLFLLPEDLMFGVLSGLRQKQLGFIVPEPEQIPSSLAQYRSLNPIVKAASPYGPRADIAQAAAAFREEPVDVVVTDCMGFTAELGRLVAQESGKQVLVPRLILPKLMKALLVQQ